MKCLDFSVKNRLPSAPARALRLLPLMLAVLTWVPAFAIEVNGLYQGSVVVNSRENEQERTRAFRDALEQVLVKVTGSTEIVNQSLVRQALTNADDYVDTWSYRTVNLSAVPGNTAPNGVGREELNVSFFEPKVLSLLDSARISLWPANRPYTLVWIVIQDERGERELIGSSVNTYPQIMNILEIEADERGLPILLPILDIDDMRAVTADDVWDMNTAKLLEASTRYQSESVLAIRVLRTLGGEVLGKSSYLFRDQVLELEVFEEPAERFIRESIDLATNELSAYYAVLLSGTQSTIEVNLTVEGISSTEDYAGLLDYVSELTDVNTFHIAWVKNQTIQLTLSTGGQLRQLLETVALNRKLEPIGELVREENQVYMRYQWNR